MNSPVLFIVFKRFDTALKVFEQIRKAQPPRLYIAADAPRLDVEGEADDCQKTRNIIKLVDWPCEVKTLFQTENQGCGLGPYKAISWFFENEEQGIVLEDDCVAHPDFFPYMDMMLDRYKNDERISLLTGRNFIEKYYYKDCSYFLSALHFCWGWASWRRVWQHYDYKLTTVKLLPYAKHLYNIWGWQPQIILWRLTIFMNCKVHPEMDVWDYQFAISTQMRETYTIIPSVNLVHNVGYDERATHTENIGYKDIEVHSILPLVHPKNLELSKEFDKIRIENSNLIKQIYRFLRTFCKYIIY